MLQKMSNSNKGVSEKGFDRIAGFYDFMACVFSFNSINKSQSAFLSHLKTQKTALILGGGTGSFLQKILEQNDTIQITYVEISPKMIARAKKLIQKKCPQDLHRVNFICKAVQDIEWQTYDLIICNYILDLFTNTYVKVLAKKFKQNLNTQGLLYVTDFDIPEKKGLLKWCTQKGLKVLYSFFRYTTQLKTKQLPKFDRILKEQGFCLTHSKQFLSGILQCSLYKLKN